MLLPRFITIGRISLFQLGQLASGVVFYFAVLIVDNFYFLGTFSVIYAVLIVTGNLATLGLHEYQYSLFDKQHPSSKGFTHIFQNLFLLYFLLSLVSFFGCAIFGLSSHYMVYVLVIFTFALNKVCFSYLNSTGRAVESAALQCCRALILFLSLITSLTLATERSIPASFLLSEVAVLAYFVFRSSIVTRERFKWVLHTVVRRSIALYPHLVLSELFIRIDVLVLSLFVVPELVGIYAFFALIIEGVLQLMYGIRLHALGQMRRLAKIVSRDAWVSVDKRVRRHIRHLQGLTFTAAVGGLVGGALFLFLISKVNSTPLQYIEIYLWLALGLIFYTIIYPFELVFIFMNRPEVQSTFTFLIALANALLNMLFIQFFGLLGAAVATAAAFMFSGFLFFIGVRHYVINCPMPSRLL